MLVYIQYCTLQKHLKHMQGAFWSSAIHNPENSDHARIFFSHE